MVVDHYGAICKYLHYTTIMSPHSYRHLIFYKAAKELLMTIMSQWVCGVLVVAAWVGSCVHSLTQIFLALSLPFCSPNVIDHYFCYLEPAQTPMWSTYLWCLIVRPFAHWVLSCWCSPMLSSCILYKTTVLKAREKPSPLVSPTSSWSCSLDLANMFPWIRW
jgi:hypothetical protein